MSISSRISSMEEHVTNAYNGLQGLGADLTNVNKNIDNIASVLDDIYNDLPKVTGSGTSITLDNTRKGRLESTLSGNTSQYTTTGKNFYSTSMLPITEYGITISKNANGDIVLNGTPNFSEGYKTFYTGDVITVEAGTYTLSVANKIAGIGCVVGGFNGGCNLTLNDTVTSKSAYADTPQNVNPAINIRYDVGTLTNFVLNPQMEKSSSATTYEPFTNGASPNPDYPQDIHVVSGDNKINVVGKNLLPNNQTTQTINGITFTINSDKSVSLRGTATTITDLYFVGTYNSYGTLPLETGTYNLNGCSGGDGSTYMLYCVGNRNGSLYYYQNFYEGGRNIIIEKGDTFRFFIRVMSGASVNTTIYPQLEKGSNATTYEPYIGTSYPINLGVENLLDLTSLNPNQVGQQVSNIQENSFIMCGTAVWGNEYFFYENTNKNTTYTASCKYLSSLARKSGLSIYGTNETTGENLTTINSLLVDIPANVETPVTNTFNSGNYDYIVFRYWNNATATALSSRVDLYVKEVQLEKGSKANTYTPYGTTPIELCKIGNYQDYFYKDSDKWYLHKEIGKVVLNGSENITTTTYSAGAYFHNIINIGLNGTNNDYAMSDYYTYSSSYMNNTCKTANGGKELVTRDNFDQSTYITWLRTNKPIFYYLLATPTITEITYQPLIDQLNLLEKAMSKDGQTNISQVNNDLPFIISASALKEWQESTSLNSTLSMVNPLSLGNTLNTQENNTQPIEVDNIEPLEEEENEES